MLLIAGSRIRIFFSNLILGVKNHLNGKSTNVYGVYEMYTKWVYLKGGIYVKVVDSRQGGGGGAEKKNHLNIKTLRLIIMK